MTQEKFKAGDLVEVRCIDSWAIGHVGYEPGDKPLTRKTNTQKHFKGNDFVWIEGRGWWTLDRVRPYNSN